MIVSEAEAVFMYYKQIPTVELKGLLAPCAFQPGINHLVLDAGGNIKTYKLLIQTLFPCNRFCDNKLSVIYPYFVHYILYHSFFFWGGGVLNDLKTFFNISFGFIIKHRIQQNILSP